MQACIFNCLHIDPLALDFLPKRLAKRLGGLGFDDFPAVVRGFRHLAHVPAPLLFHASHHLVIVIGVGPGCRLLGKFRGARMGDGIVSVRSSGKQVRSLCADERPHIGNRRKPGENDLRGSCAEVAVQFGTKGQRGLLIMDDTFRQNLLFFRCKQKLANGLITGRDTRIQTSNFLLISPLNHTAV